MAFAWAFGSGAQPREFLSSKHGGSWGGQNSDFFFVPDRRFAMTVLTNSTGGSKLIDEISRSNWALHSFCGLSNPPAEAKPQPRANLSDYEGHYKGLVIPPEGPPEKIEELHVELTTERDKLRATGDLKMSDYVVATDPEGQVKRSDFLRGRDGNVA